MKVVPIMTDDLASGKPDSFTQIADSDLVVTTFFHLDEVRSLFPSRTGDILGIALDPLIESIVHIARLPTGTKVLLVCISERFAERILKSMEIAGITEVDVEVTTDRNLDSVRERLKDKKAVVVSPGRLREVSSLVKRGTQVIEFIYKPDAGSVNLLRASVLEHRRKNRQEGVDRGSRRLGSID